MGPKKKKGKKGKKGAEDEDVMENLSVHLLKVTAVGSSLQFEN